MKLGGFPSNKFPEIGLGSYFSESSSFSPTDISGLLLWLNASDITSLNDGDAITTWTDSSGNGENCTQAVAGAKPSYQTNEINGLPVVRFDGGDRLTNASLSGLGTGAWTWIGVVKRSGGTGYRTFFSIGDGTGGALLSAENTTSNIMLNANGSALSWCVDGAMTDATPLIIIARSNGSGTYAIHKQGTAEDSDVTPVNAPAGYVIGDYLSAGGQPFTGDFAELVLYNSSLGVDDTASVVTYMQDKYGL